MERGRRGQHRHGGELETSLQLFLRSSLVDMSRAVKDEWRLKFTPEVGRYARFPERRREMEHGVMGDPHVASAEKGEKLFVVLLDRLVACVASITRSNRRAPRIR